jgi:hypothetical protein
LKSYEKILTIKDDYQSGDDYVDLFFEDLNKELNYTLEIDPGNEEEAYSVFENIPFIELSGLSSQFKNNNEADDEESPEPPPEEPENSTVESMEEDASNEIEYDSSNEVDYDGGAGESTNNEDIDDNDENEEEMDDEIPEDVVSPFTEDD